MCGLRRRLVAFGMAALVLQSSFSFSGATSMYEQKEKPIAIEKYTEMQGGNTESTQDEFSLENPLMEEEGQEETIQEDKEQDSFWNIDLEEDQPAFDWKNPSSVEEGSQESAEDILGEVLQEEPLLMEENTEEELLWEAELAAGDSNHQITMPDRTSHYFWLQKGSNPVAKSSASHLIKLSGEKEVSQYMQNQYKNGKQYSFVPRFTKNTKVTVGGGSGGGISLDSIYGGDNSQFGELYVMASRLQTKAFNLDKCTTDPYAIYTNVGSWYDQEQNEMFQVDMKISIIDYEYPGEETQKSLHTRYKAPYAAFVSNTIGIVAMGTDSIETMMEFYYHGTETPIKNLKGMMQFIDIDAQQGVDFAQGFQDLIMFQTDQTKMRYNSLGAKDRSIGYVCSGTAEAFNYRDVNTTAIGIFSGSLVDCIWSIARCDQKDTGGSALFKESAGYDIPADSSFAQASCYATNKSTGFIGIDTDVASITLPPQIKKAVYRGNIQEEKSETTKTSVTLAGREEPFTFVLSAASSMPSDFERAHYSKFYLEDLISPFLQVTNVKVYAGVNQGSTDSEVSYEDVTTNFNRTVTEQKDGSSQVSIHAKNGVLTDLSFYGKNYYAAIEVRFRTDQELKDKNLSITQCYQTDNQIGKAVGDGANYKGSYAVLNQANLQVTSTMDTSQNLTSNDVAVKIPMKISVMKTDKNSKEAVSGVVFGLFAGDASTHSDSREAIATAKTNAEGVAILKKDSFYQESYGDGPYYVKEISVPDKYRRVWETENMKSWSISIPSLLSESLVAEEKDLAELSLRMENQNVIMPEEQIKVVKKNSESGKILAGAEFVLQEWSETNQKYQNLMTLQEDEVDGEICYRNPQGLVNTMDNLGSYKIIEKKSPKGCVLTGEFWKFKVEAESKGDGANLIYLSSEEGKEEKGQITYENPLQRATLHILKKDDQGSVLEGVSFELTSAQDIYAPWDLDLEGKPYPDAKALMKKGETAATLTTDDHGRASVSNLYLGSYTLKETKAAKGYIKDEQVYKLVFNLEEESLEQTLEISNVRMKPAYAVAKLANKTTDSKGEKPLLQAESGRYPEKIAATYGNKETVDYCITVTNTGNVPLEKIHLSDKMDEKNKEGQILFNYIEKEESKYDLPRDGILTSQKSQTIQAKLAENNSMELILDHLDVGDCVEIHLVTKVRQDVSSGFGLKNLVQSEASYYSEEGNLTKVDTSELIDAEGKKLTEDEDMIHVPGKSLVSIAKCADKTSGATLVEGRYQGIKTEGIYQTGEQVSYKITVTNKGNTDLYNLQVKDTLSKELAHVLETDSVQLEIGKLTSVKGQSVQAKKQNMDSSQEQCIVLDHLQAGDAVEVHMTARLKESAVGAYQGLVNKVTLQAQYYGKDQELIDIPQTEEMTDEDKISLGQPELRICKLADKTTGVALQDGRAEGEKVPGTYYAGEEISYSILVSNVGTGPAYKIIVADAPSLELQKYAQMKGFGLEKGTKIKTNQNADATILATTSNKIAIDQLAAGDSVKLTFTALLKEDITLNQKEVSALNQVSVTGRYADDQSIPETEYMKDQDNVRLLEKKEGGKLPANNESVSGGNGGSNSSGLKGDSPLKTGDDNPILLYGVICILAIVAVITLYRRKKRM